MYREGKLSEFEVAPSITHTPRLGESIVLNCVPPTSFPPADVEWVLKTREGQIEPINYNNRISMDLEGQFQQKIELLYMLLKIKLLPSIVLNAHKFLNKEFPTIQTSIE